ncbi:MAG: LCP family protein, partial [Thermoleophilia bacterium]
IPGFGQAKLNEAYTDGQLGGHSGSAKVIETLNQLTGQSIQGFFNVDFQGFANLVNKIGGVYIDVDRRYYHVNTGTAASNFAPIDIQPGYQRLLGNDALSFVRYRHYDSDLSRIARQQMFLTEVKRRTHGQLSQAPDLLSAVAHATHTNFRSASFLLQLARWAISIPDGRVFKAQINGIGAKTSTGADIQMVSQTELQQKLQEWQNPPFLNTAAVAKVNPADVTVNVLNGSGRTLVSQRMAEILRAKGYQASPAGNAAAFDHTTTSVGFSSDRQGSLQAAQNLQAALGPNTGLVSVPVADLGAADAVVIVGTDFTGQPYVPPKPSKTAKPAGPAMANTTSLVSVMRSLGQATGMHLMAPLQVAAGSSVKYIRSYRVNTNNVKGQGPQAVKIVFDQIGSDGSAQYWGIEATVMKDPPILDGPTGIDPRLGTSHGLVSTQTYYNGKTLMREGFTYRGVHYWVSNTINTDHALTPETMHAIARSFRPVGAARLPKGAHDTPISIEPTGVTP